MPKDIGAGTVIDMGSAAAPTVLARLANTVTSLPFSTSQGTVDITTLDTENRWRDFLATLRTATGSTTYIDDTTGAAFRKFSAIQGGQLHPDGNGKVDVRMKYGGDVPGNFQVDFTMIITQVDFNAELETALGGNLSYQFTGEPTFGVQA